MPDVRLAEVGIWLHVRARAPEVGIWLHVRARAPEVATEDGEA